MQYLYYNGQFLPENQAIFTANNRGFCYGDALFESMVLFDGKIPFWQAHLTRLENSSRILAFKLNGYSSKENLHQACLTLAQKNNIGKNARLRLQVFRAAGGLYTPTNNNTEIIITLKPLNNNNFVWQKKGLTLGVYQNMVKQYNLLANLKTNNCLPYIMGALYKQQQAFDDCCIINDQGRIAETISANVFAVSNNKLYTPPLTEAGVAGIMRQKVLFLAQKMGVNCNEIPIHPIDLPHFDEIFLTNAVQGIKWVKNYEKKMYNTKVSYLIFQELLKHVNEK